MKSKEEIKQWLLENAMNEYGEVDLSDIDFGNLTVLFNGVKATYIFNKSQQAYYIDNYSQKANYIHNHLQEAKNSIYNKSQQAYYIHNHLQEAKNSIYNHLQEAKNEYCNLYAKLEGKVYEVDNTDNMYLMIEKKQTRNGVNIINGISRTNDKVYLYKNEFVAYHAYTKEEAKEGFNYKLKGFEANKELIEQIKEKGLITRDEYHNLTGACYVGIQEFAERICKPKAQELSLKELRNVLTSNDYGYEYLKKWGVLDE